MKNDGIPACFLVPLGFQCFVIFGERLNDRLDLVRSQMLAETVRFLGLQ